MVSNPIATVDPDYSRHAGILISAILISFVGSLPLGTVNVVMVQVAITDGSSSALWFAAGCLIAEMFCIAISIAIMNRIMRFDILIKMLPWVSLIILATLAIALFAEAVRGNTRAGIVFVPDTLPPFFFGFLLMAVNPVQIPFWFGWSTVLFEKKILIPDAVHYGLYLAGAGLGSLMGSILFIFGGQVIFAWFPIQTHTLYWLTGGIFTFAAFFQVRKILRQNLATKARRHKAR